jgi:two-component system cell cycle response regulator DivK
MCATLRRASNAPTVLLVDDSLDTREMYTEFLSLSGFIVSSAGEGARAFEDAISSPPDIVVTDIILPGDVDGLELIRRLRRETRTKDLVIVVLSGREIGGDKEEAEEAGCDLFLGKPCLPDKLASELRRIIKER